MRGLVGTFLPRGAIRHLLLGVPCARSPGRQRAPASTKGLSCEGTSRLQLAKKELPDPGLPVPPAPPLREAPVNSALPTAPAGGVRGRAGAGLPGLSVHQRRPHQPLLARDWRSAHVDPRGPWGALST